MAESNSETINTVSSALLWLGSIAFLGAIVFLIWWGNVNHDEIEHLAVAFRILTGDTPYRDFHQNHTPFYWYVLLPLVERFPKTLIPLYAARALSVGLIAVVSVLGISLLKYIEGPKRIRVSVYLFSTLALVPSMEMQRARPDSLMLLFSSFAFFLMVSKQDISKKRIFTIGALMMLAVCASLKMALLCGIFPLILCFAQHGVSLQERIKQLLAYTAGSVLGTAPVALYFYYKGLLSEFIAQVVIFNSELSKHSYFANLEVPLHIAFFPCVTSIIFAFVKRKELNQQQKRIHLTSALWIVLGYLIAVLASHPSEYNHQIILVPAAFSLTFLFLEFYTSFRLRGYAIAITLWFVLAPSLYMLPSIFTHSFLGDHLRIEGMQEVIRLSPGTDSTCLAFAPVHPIYCKNASRLMISWDLDFLKALKTKSSHASIVAAWREARKRIVDGDVHFVTKSTHTDLWLGAYTYGAFTKAEYLELLDAMSQYREITIGLLGPKVWVRTKQ